MEQINLRKFKGYKDGARFEFRYEGISNNVFDKEKVDKMLDAFLSKEALHRDMLRNVAYIRTILKDVKEKLLVIEYKDSESVETVKYDSGFLFFFECRKYDGEDYIEVKFTPGNQLEVSFPDSEDNITKYPQTKATKEKFGKIIDHITPLIDVGCVHLDNDIKAIIETYRLFYNENPDFTKDDINIRIQAMLHILAQFNICFGSYKFAIIENTPQSLLLSQKIDKLFPLGEIVDLDDSVELKPKSKKVIKIVSNVIKEQIADETNINEVLIAISKTLYAARCSTDSIYDVWNIKSLIGYSNINLTYNEAKSSVQLIKTIDKKLEENI